MSSFYYENLDFKVQKTIQYYQRGSISLLELTNRLTDLKDEGKITNKKAVAIVRSLILQIEKEEIRVFQELPRSI